ncbi:MAG: L,D-transpeptidase [Gammaproteobacteria bacterium]|nr:L,D-transpeptidase [Gammaproteobacteria bacterium]
MANATVRLRGSHRAHLTAFVLCLLGFFAGPVVAAPYHYEIEIDKSARLLIVRAGEQILKTFHISVGRGGLGDKAKRGDKRTPIGTYRVVGFNERSRFDTFVRLNYPNIKDAYYGLRNAVISRTEFDAIVAALRAGRTPPQNTALGGAIGIHGIGEETPDKIRIHDNLDWTEGCIALRNREIHELRHFLELGTRVVIRE